MIKRTKNDKVVRALAIGLAAMLANTTPLTALAAESDGQGMGDTQPTEPVSGEEQQTASSEFEAVEEAAESSEGYIEDVKEDALTIPEAAKDLSEAADGLDNTESKTEEGRENIDSQVEAMSEAASGLATEMNEAHSDIDVVQTQIETMEASESVIADNIDKVESAVESAETISSEVDKVVEDANAVVDEKTDVITNATTIDEANTAYEEANAAVEEAKAVYEEKLDEYTTVKSEYEAALAKVNEFTEKYNTALASAQISAEAALKDLEEAQAQVDKLSAELTSVETELQDSFDGAADIMEKAEAVATATSQVWRRQDDLFVSMMKNYYLPKEGITDENVEVTRVQGTDDNTQNYFEVVYTNEAGEKVVEYYNYIRDTEDSNDIVIFEKRDIEVKYYNTTPSEEDAEIFVDNEGNVVYDSLEAEQTAKESGEVVEIDGKLYKVDKESTTTTTTNELLDEGEEATSEATTTNKTTDDAFVDETVSYDSITSDEDDILTKEEAEAEVVEKAAELGITDVEEVKSKVALYEKYYLEGYYIPLYEKTVDIDEVYESKDVLIGVESEEEAKSKAEDEAKDIVDDAIEGDHILVGEVSTDLDVSMTERGGIFGWDDPDYNVTGTATANYAKVDTCTTESSTWDNILQDISSWFTDEDSANEKLEQWFSDTYKDRILISAKWSNRNTKTASIRYIQAYEISTGKQDTKEEAIETAWSQVKTAADDASVSSVLDMSDVTINEDSTFWIFGKTYEAEAAELEVSTAYDYELEYKTVSTTTTDVTKLTPNVQQNKNYYDGIWLLDQNSDQAYNDWLGAKDKYDILKTQVDKAQTDLTSAVEAVNTLKAEIDKLKEKAYSAEELATLEARFKQATLDMEEAQKNLDDLEDKLDDAKEALDDTIDRLTPDPTPAPTPSTDEPTATTPATTTTAVTTAAATDAMTIADQGVPLADSIEDSSSITIDEESVALADSITSPKTGEPFADVMTAQTEESKSLPWMWSVAVMLLGGTGYEMYKRSQQKKDK